jgi:prevent-host-death family protein
MAASRLNNRQKNSAPLKEANAPRRPKEEVKALEEVEGSLRPFLNRIRRTKCRTILTEAGKPAFVVMDVATYDLLQRSIKFALLVGAGEADYRMGRTIPAEQVFRELNRGKKVSG